MSVLEEFDEDLFQQICESELDLLKMATSSTTVNQSRAKHWCFTTNNYTEEHVERLRQYATDPRVAYVVFGREVGDTGTPHLQGFITFSRRVRFNEAQERLPDSHLTITRQVQNSIQYCKKDGDFEEYGLAPDGPGHRSDLEAFKLAVKGGLTKLKDVRENFSEVYSRYPVFCKEYIRDFKPAVDIPSHPLRVWQAKLNHDLNLPPDSRQIVFIVDFTGNSGKSWFARYYCSLHENAQILPPTKKADMAYALELGIRVLFLDCPRSKQGDYIQYDFLEELKNGFVMSNKYESFVKTFSPMHVVVLMNEKPDMTKLSSDRYKIMQLSSKDNQLANHLDDPQIELLSPSI